MQNQNKKKVFIFGSCVSRDAFNLPSAANFEIVDYFSRSSIATLSSSKSVKNVKTENISSSFQRRMVERDINHSFLETIRYSNFDILLIDPIDERFNLYIENNDALCTLSNELLSSGFITNEENGAIIKSGTEEFFRKWEDGWERLISFLFHNGKLSKLYINETYWGAVCDDGKDYAPSYSKQAIEDANLFLYRIYAKMREDIPEYKFIKFDKKYIIGSQEHRWGRSPFHFIDAYYEELLNQLTSIRLENEQKENYKSYAMISVDVEALPGRADQNHVDILIYGKFNGKQYGIDRLCDIFDSYGIKATFFVDFACCCIHGDEKIFSAARLIEQRGHDVQLHMHSEVLVRNQNWHYDKSLFPDFENIPYETAKQVLNYGIKKYTLALGRRPRIFRPGGMKKSYAMYAACQAVGIPAVSASFRFFDEKLWRKYGNQSILRLENGIYEIPLDRALDPLLEWQPFQEDQMMTLSKKESISYLIHSTSLLFRERDSDAKFTCASEEYEETLKKYIQSTKLNAEFITHDQLFNLKKQKCSTISFKEYGLVDFDFKFYHENQDNIVDCNLHLSPTIVPIRMVDGQIFRLLVVDDNSGSIKKIPYVISGRNLYVQLDRSELPFNLPPNKVANILYETNRNCERIIFQRICSAPHKLNAQHIPAGSAYFITLPETIEQYENEIISKNLLSELKRESRRMRESNDGYEFCLIKPNDIHEHNLKYAAELINKSLEEKFAQDKINVEQVTRQLPYYQKNGHIIVCRKNQTEIGAALVYQHEKKQYLMAAGSFRNLTKFSIGKHIILHSIYLAIESGMETFNLGGGDFGYKTRFGAVEKKFYNMEYYFNYNPSE